MTQEDKQLLFKDLCARLPYGVTCHANEINLDGDLLFINKVYKTVALYNDKAIGKFDTCPIDDVKPYLRPMSSMTEEEFLEYHKIKYNKVTYRHGYERIDVGKFHNVGIIPIEDYVDWLNSHHFDYRGIIKKGLALEAPVDMYKTD